MSETRANPSPRLGAKLAELRRRLTGGVWLYGLGTVVGATALWLLYCFLADWLLHVPGPVRLAHTAVLVLVPVWLARREIARRLARVPRDVGLAILVERAFPGLRQLLVSAVELPRATLEADAAPLVARVVADAEDVAPDIDLDAVVDRRPARRRAAAGAAVALVATAAFAAQPGLSAIFFARMLGRDVPWPQRTHLTVEVPVAASRARVEADESRIHVRVARGSDVPVVVRAEGVVPEEVMLHFSSGQTAVLSSGGGEIFRTLLRSVQEDLEFHVTGGDDDDGLPRVRLTVLLPPDIAGLAVAIVPPAYSGLPARTERDRDVEVLEGSELTVFVAPDPPDARGLVRLLPEDRTLELAERPFPEAAPEGAEAGTAAAGDAAAPRAGLAFELVAEESLRYRFELTDATGLANPDPGLFGVQVIEDRRPDVLLISPARAEVDVVAGGALALRVRAEDDYGLASLEWHVSSASGEEPLSSGALEGRPGEGPDDGTAARTRVARTRLEVDRLRPGEPPAEDARLVLQILATDNREPTPNASPSAPVYLRVVSGDEFLRRLQASLAQASEQAGRLLRLQEEKLQRTRELMAALSGDELEAGDEGQVGVLATGQRRVHGDARALARDLAAIAESLLYSRVDERAGPLLEALEVGLADALDKSFHPEPWSELAERYETGALGAAGLAGQLVKIVGLALEVSEQHTLAAADALENARIVPGPSGRHEALEGALARQGQAIERIGALLEQLAEWDNYQSVLTLTRDLLNRQKNLKERTGKFVQEH